MRPVLKISDIQDLHDARYCAAVGVQLISFRLTSIENVLSPHAVKEILEWLSGPKGIGEFQDESPQTINETAASAKVDFVSIPLEYPISQAIVLDATIIFRHVSPSLTETSVSRINELAKFFPSALFEFPSQGLEKYLQLGLLDAELLDRSLLRVDDPNDVYQLLKQNGIKPFGFALGTFVAETVGTLDYAKCDDFISAYHSLLHA